MKGKRDNKSWREVQGSVKVRVRNKRIEKEGVQTVIM